MGKKGAGTKGYIKNLSCQRTPFQLFAGVVFTIQDFACNHTS